MSYFYDTYAIPEYMSGRKRYRPYFEEDYGFLNVLNHTEICYSLLKEQAKRRRMKGYSASSRFLCEFDGMDIKEAMKLRLNLQSRGLNVSYSDALGYQFSMKFKVKFLTGDFIFKELENVKHVR